MKNGNGSGKGGSAHKAGSSAVAAATPSAVVAADRSGRKSRWEPDQKSPSSNLPNPISKPQSNIPKQKDSPADSSAPSAPSVPALKDHHPSGLPLPGAGVAHRSSFAAGGPQIFPFSDLGPPPPPPPSYGFDNLERRTIVLVYGTVRSYFALPPDYPMQPMVDKFFTYGPGGRAPFPHGLEPGFPHRPGRLSPEDFRLPPRPPYGHGPEHEQEYWPSSRRDGPQGALDVGSSSSKRRYGEEDDLAWHRQHVLQYGNPIGVPSSAADRGDFFGRTGSPDRDYHDKMRLSKQVKLGGEGYRPPTRLVNTKDAPPAVVDVEWLAFKRAFLKLYQTINENVIQRKNYLEDGKNGPLSCVVCGRSSKDFADTHDLLMHAYNSKNADLRADHLGLHKALCVLMGWDYSKAPENNKVYQFLPAEEAEANREDLILWPPIVIIHNTSSGRRKDGRVEGISNKEMDIKLKELGFGGGKAKSVYGKEGHKGMTAVKFANTQAGLKEAEQLADYFLKDNHGRRAWARVQAYQLGDDDPALVKIDERTGEKKRTFYGYLATAFDIEKVESDIRKKVVVKSRNELEFSN